MNMMSSPDLVTSSYKTVRPTIKSGDLIAFSHRGWSTWYDIKLQLIRIFTRSEYTHVGVAWVVAKRVFILEAVVPLTRIFPLSKFNEFYHIDMNVKWTVPAEEYALAHIGYPYSQLDAVKSLFETVGDEQVNQCAAYTIQVMEVLEVDLGKRATPSSVIQAALALGKKLTFIKN
jgi:hypothetical protein